jgi:lambda repressor-like predicted transcriptional regulator
MSNHRLPIVDTPLANWLNERMARWQDPETRVYGLTSRQLALHAGISTTEVLDIMKQGHTPKGEALNSLALFFNVEPEVLWDLAYRPDYERRLAAKEG